DAGDGRAAIVGDGGIYRGTDLVKAVALGADAVGVGRLLGLGMGAGGSAGVVRMLELLEDEVQTCLGLMGMTSLADVDRSMLRSAPLVTEPGLLSAFPLIDVPEPQY
ncbi:MAG: alpha-hydroxy-acid oxidizing protein, partial [Rhodospirillales bacterium]|nr:alpha-hydroxy-acid oxidizing protein [Rhodospirillales bacterium]